jgi:hypothetical protein
LYVRSPWCHFVWKNPAYLGFEKSPPPKKRLGQNAQKNTDPKFSGVHFFLDLFFSGSKFYST